MNQQISAWFKTPKTVFVDDSWLVNENSIQDNIILQISNNLTNSEINEDCDLDCESLFEQFEGRKEVVIVTDGHLCDRVSDAIACNMVDNKIEGLVIANGCIRSKLNGTCPILPGCIPGKQCLKRCNVHVMHSQTTKKLYIPSFEMFKSKSSEADLDFYLQALKSDETTIIWIDGGRSNLMFDMKSEGRVLIVSTGKLFFHKDDTDETKKMKEIKILTAVSISIHKQYGIEVEIIMDSETWKQFENMLFEGCTEKEPNAENYEIKKEEITKGITARLYV